MITCFCGNDIPIWCSVMWCDDCLDEIHETKENGVEFIARKEAERKSRVTTPTRQRD